MSLTLYDEVYDQTGKLVSRTERVALEPAPSADERIADLEQQLATVKGALDAVGKASSFANAKLEIASRMADVSVAADAGAAATKGA